MTFQWIYYIHPKTVKLSETKFENSDRRDKNVAASNIKFITKFIKVGQNFEGSGWLHTNYVLSAIRRI